MGTRAIADVPVRQIKHEGNDGNIGNLPNEAEVGSTGKVPPRQIRMESPTVATKHVAKVSSTGDIPLRQIRIERLATTEHRVEHSTSPNVWMMPREPKTSREYKQWPCPIPGVAGRHGLHQHKSKL